MRHNSKKRFMGTQTIKKKQLRTFKRTVVVTTALLVGPASAGAADAAKLAVVMTALLVRLASAGAADAAKPVVVTTALLVRPASAGALRTPQNRSW